MSINLNEINALKGMSVEDAMKAVADLPENDQLAMLRLLEEYEKTQVITGARTDFLSFVQHMWPGFIFGRHHRIMANAFDRVLSGDCKRLIINMAPRHTKSEFASIYLPAYFLGQNPDKKIIQATHTAELAQGFGRKVRGLVNSEDFGAVFPDVRLSSESKAAGRWSTNKGGEYFAVGTSGAVAGKGADLFVIDDPIDEQDAQYGEYNSDVYEKLYDWYTLVRQRLQPNAAIIIVMTRWSKRDLTGRLIKEMQKNRNADQWEVIEFPAIMPSGQPLWPEYWPLSDLMATKASIPQHRWNAQYQQNPISEQDALIKRADWCRWTKDRPPQCSSVLMSWDTAYEKNSRADYSACTVWGVFEHHDEKGRPQEHIILLDAFRGKWEFPELKHIAKKKYLERDPDMVVIEKKAAGGPLIYELRQIGIPVQEFTPVKGNDKITRANGVTDIFASGMVWAPETKWAEDVIQECAEFPNGENDDYVDTVTQALLRFRQGGFLRLRSDEDEDDHWRYRQVAAYY